MYFTQISTKHSGKQFNFAQITIHKSTQQGPLKKYYKKHIYQKKVLNKRLFNV